jgi:hypothetical protein
MFLRTSGGLPPARHRRNGAMMEPSCPKRYGFLGRDFNMTRDYRAALGNADTDFVQGTKELRTAARTSGMSRDTHLKPHVQEAKDEIASQFGIKNIGGWRPASQTIDTHGHGVGRALDVMVGDKKELGDQVVQYAKKNADRLGVQYIIWQQQISHYNAKAQKWSPWKLMGDRGKPGMSPRPERR